MGAQILSIFSQTTINVSRALETGIRKQELACGYILSRIDFLRGEKTRTNFRLNQATLTYNRTLVGQGSYGTQK